jgi:hypothetical protein
MIFEELVLKTVSEIETSHPGDLSSVAAIYVETRFNMQDSGGINIPSLREELKAEAVNVFSSYYADLRKDRHFFISNTVAGTAITSEGNNITLERVEFINLGEEECENVIFKKVFFIPLGLLGTTTAGPGAVPDDGAFPTGRAPTPMPTMATLKICNYRDFKTKSKFIQTFMKVNFLALQRPAADRIVKGINFRKFSFRKKKISKFIDFLDDVVINKPNRDGESIIIHFANNFQTVSKIEYVNEKVSDAKEVIFLQSEDQFEVRRYKKFNDARANFYLYNFESIYPDLFATTFRRRNIEFSSLVRRNFEAPGVKIVKNDCLTAAGFRQGAATAGAEGRINQILQQSLSDAAAKEARELLKDSPFKTAEDLIKESKVLESGAIGSTMKAGIREEFRVGGKSIKHEVMEFFEQLQTAGAFIGSDQESKKLSKFGQFANSISWQQILAIALASVASRYGIDEILDDSFIKKIMAERISKFFKDPRTINALMSGLPTSALQRAALFFAAADLANSVGGGFSIEERRLRRLNRLLAERDRLAKEEPPDEERIGEVTQRIQRAKERLGKPTSLIGLLEELGRDLDPEDRTIIEEEAAAARGAAEEGLNPQQTEEQLLEREFDLQDDPPSLEEIEAEEEPGAGNRGTNPSIVPKKEADNIRRRLVKISAPNGEFTGEAKNEIIDLIINLSNCDRQNNAEVYTDFIMFLIDELGAPVLEYFDEWSEWLNAWDVKNLDFCNLPDLNIPDFKLFPLNIRWPQISMPDIFGFMIGAILSILYGLLLRLIHALIQFLLSLIPDFIFDFEPCEFANALRDFGQVLGGAMCAGMNGVDVPSLSLCSVLGSQTNNERNNRDLLNFFKDACGKGILPGPDLARLLEGDANEGTYQRADAYFRSVNSELAAEIRSNPSILTDTGSAMGSVIGIGDLLDSLDSFSPRMPGLSANGLVSNLDLCSDPSISDLIDQLCTEPNPALRNELENILAEQREADKDDAAKIFKYLTDPDSLTKEIEDQLPNQAHPSLLIPPLAAAGQTNELPVIKNTPKFALNRDQETLKDLHEDGIKARLGSLDACVTAYGTSLVKRSKRYEDKLDKLNSPLRPVEPENGPIPVPLPQGAGGGFLTAAFNNDLFYINEMPEAAKVLATRYAEEDKIVDWSESFDIGLKFYNEQVYTPLTEALALPALIDPLNGLLTDEDLYSTSYGALNTQRIKEGQFVRQALEKVRFHGEVDFNALSRQIEAMGKDIAIASLKNRLENAGIDLEPAVVDELMTESEELPPAGAEDDDAALPVVDNSNLLPSSQLEEIIDDYLEGSFKQEKTYKRFIKDLPEFSQLLLTKTDDEIVSIQENIKAIFTCILLEDAHLRFAVLDAGGRIFSTNDLSTAIYNRSLLALEVKRKVNTLFFDFKVNYLNNKIRGWNAISYYVYEIAKITGQLSSLNRSLGRRVAPQDLMHLLLEEVISSVSKSFATNLYAATYDTLQYSNVIEGSTDNSIIYNFKTPNLLGGHMKNPDLRRFLEYSVAPDGSEQTFLTSNMCFAVTLKGGTLVDSLGALALSDITSPAQRSGTNSSSFTIDHLGAGKGDLQTAVLESLKAGETVLLGYDDVFGANPNISLMNKLLAYAEYDQSLNDFVFENFNVKIRYRVFVTYVVNRLQEDSALDLSVLGTNREAQTLGLYKGQKISVMYARQPGGTYSVEVDGTPIPGLGGSWDARPGGDKFIGGRTDVEPSPDAEAVEPTIVFDPPVGATFIMTELCSFEYDVPAPTDDYNMIESSQQLLTEGKFISILMNASSTSELANTFKGNDSINIFLSCILPIPNIINQATSYSVERVQDQIGSSPGEVRDIIFKPVKIQNMICAMVSKRLLKNV